MQPTLDLILDYYQKSPSRKIHLASILSIEWGVDMIQAIISIVCENVG